MICAQTPTGSRRVQVKNEPSIKQRNIRNYMLLRLTELSLKSLNTRIPINFCNRNECIWVNQIQGNEQNSTFVNRTRNHNIKMQKAFSVCLCVCMSDRLSSVYPYWQLGYDTIGFFGILSYEDQRIGGICLVVSNKLPFCQSFNHINFVTKGQSLTNWDGLSRDFISPTGIVSEYFYSKGNISVVCITKWFTIIKNFKTLK